MSTPQFYPSKSEPQSNQSHAQLVNVLPRNKHRENIPRYLPQSPHEHLTPTRQCQPTPASRKPPTLLRIAIEIRCGRKRIWTSKHKAGRPAITVVANARKLSTQSPNPNLLAICTKLHMASQTRCHVRIVGTFGVASKQGGGFPRKWGVLLIGKWTLYG